MDGAELEHRLSVIELMIADLFCRAVPDAAAMRDWTERTAEQVRRQAEARQDENPEVSIGYIAAWDAMLATVRETHAWRGGAPGGRQR